MARLAEGRWARFGSMLQARSLRLETDAATARAAAAELRESTTRALCASRAGLRPHSAIGAAASAAAAAAARPPRAIGQDEALSEWVPVIDVFSSARLSESEEALMRRVIASRVAPAPTISYTGRPL